MQDKELKEEFIEGCKDIDGTIWETDREVTCTLGGKQLSLLKGQLFAEPNKPFKRAIIRGKGGKGSISGVRTTKVTRSDNSLTVWGKNRDYVKLSEEDLRKEHEEANK